MYEFKNSSGHTLENFKCMGHLKVAPFSYSVHDLHCFMNVVLKSSAICNVVHTAYISASIVFRKY